MKKIFLVVFTVILGTFQVLFAQTPCENGEAAGFPCSGFDLQDSLTNDELDTSFVNDSWGWTDPLDGKEYALVGLIDGTAFIDISIPTDVVYLGKLPTHTTESVWRDIKVYQDHAFIVSEAPGHGMQVFDLTRLRDVTSVPVTFTEDAHYDGFGNAHNIVINPESGFAYGVGTSTFLGGPHFVDIQDPLNPVAAGGYDENNYSHDAQVVTYNGPDPDYAGREILIGSNENLIAIVDITDKDNPTEIATITYPAIGFTHQGWFTEDQRFFLLGDELDEISFGFNTRTIIFDFEDLDNPAVHFEYEGTNPSTDHNGYVVGNLFYLASYRAGMRVLDISNIANLSMIEIGYFDTFPDNDNVGTSGLWNVYPFFESGNIVLSGDLGFAVVRANQTLNTDSFTVDNELSIYPNPANDFIILQSTQQIGEITVYSVLGQQVMRTTAGRELQLNIAQLKPGFYFIKTRLGTQRIIKT
jgi:choice-of-anchor B domain-containing protein